MNLQVTIVGRRYNYSNVKSFEMGEQLTIIRFSDGSPEVQFKTKDIISLLNRTDY